MVLTYISLMISGIYTFSYTCSKGNLYSIFLGINKLEIELKLTVFFLVNANISTISLLFGILNGRHKVVQLLGKVA